MKKEVVSTDAAKQSASRKQRTKKHIVIPLTADQISKRVGVTKKDAALVTKVLLELGYLRKEDLAKREPAPTRAKPSKVGSTRR